MSRIEELRQARAGMNAVRERIYGLAEGRSDAELLRVPTTGGWCAAEVIDHLRTAESKLVKGLVKVGRGERVNLPRLCWYYRLPMGIAFVPFKIEAPKPVRPKAAADIRPQEAVEGLRSSRRDLLAFADTIGEEKFAKFLFPHFLLGRFDGLDWFRFLTRHEARHEAQMKRILSGSMATHPLGGGAGEP